MVVKYKTCRVSPANNFYIILNINVLIYFNYFNSRKNT
jgi:hypothetical protein